MEPNNAEIRLEPTAAGQLCKNIKGRPLTREERKEKQERTKKRKEKMAKLKRQQEIPEETIEENTKSEFFDEESDVWVEEVKAPTPIELQDEDDDTYVPPAKVPTQKRQKIQPIELTEDIVEPIQFKPIPPIGTSLDNPIVNEDVYGVIERLYSDIGYFILSEQVAQYRRESIRVVQLKLDDGRFINLFVKI
jgi:hypothetical protein